MSKILAALLVFLATAADIVIFWWLLVVGIKQLYAEQFYPACALICTAVIYQRLEKAQLVNQIEHNQPKG